LVGWLVASRTLGGLVASRTLGGLVAGEGLSALRHSQGLGCRMPELRMPEKRTMSPAVTLTRKARCPRPFAVGAFAPLRGAEDPKP